MADLPEPVDMTARVSWPASRLSIASRWPGRSASKPIASRATRSIGSVRPRRGTRSGLPPGVARLASPAMDLAWSGRRLHFVGIGGAGMSGLALVARWLGATVTGSGRSPDSPYLAPLRELGVQALPGHDAAHVPPDAEVVVSSAIAPDNPELGRGTRELHRADLLGELTRIKPTIAIAGTHGKTTTSSMAVHALRGCGMDPSYLVGGEVRSTGANAGWGTGECLVVEADESDRSLLNLSPRIAVVTNAELDHHTTYASRRDVDDTFRAFLALAERPVVWAPLAALAPGATTFDVEPELTAGGSRFAFEGAAVTLNVPGAHNARNAAAAL